MKDAFTKFLLKSINTMFLYNVIGTSYGIIFGVLLLSLQDFISLIFPPILLIKWYGFIVFGVLIFNIKAMISKKYTDPHLEKILQYTREVLKEGDLSQQDINKLWKQTIQEIHKYLFENHKNNTQHPSTS